MKRKTLSLLFLVLFTSAFPVAFASHIMGGSITYQWKSGTRFLVTLIFYRDCSVGSSDFDGLVTIGTFDKVTNQEVYVFDLPFQTRDTLELGDKNFKPSNLCIEYGVFSDTIDFFQLENPNGYYLSWQRCCRNSSITNILSPGQTSMTFYTEMPDPALHNSSPEFAGLFGGFVCYEKPNALNWKFVDQDMDSIGYMISAPLASNGATQTDPIPDPSPGPYPEIQWQTSYGPGNVFGGQRDMDFERNGTAHITPPKNGVFAYGIIVQEFRDKVKIGEVRVDIQYKVVPGCEGIGIGIAPVQEAKLNTSVFPNPVSSTLNISYPYTGEKHAADIHIYDIFGRSLKHFSFNKDCTAGCSMPMKELPDGTYFLKVINGSHQSIQRVVKMD